MKKNFGLKVSLTEIWKLAVFMMLGMLVFFLAAVLVLSARLKPASQVAVPLLVGKSYLDEHNMLQEKSFKVKLDIEHSLLYPYGFILSQHPAAGKVVSEGSKISLTVNQSENVLKVPNLIGNHIDLAKTSLQNIHYGPHTFSLRLGVVTIIDSSRSQGEVLAQFPLPEDKVSPNTPVDVLVSGKNKLTSLNEQMKGNSIEIAKQVAFLKETPLEIKPQQTEEAQKYNKVLHAVESDNHLVVQVGKAPESKNNVYRVRWIDPIKVGLQRGVYTVARLREDKTTFDNFTYLFVTSEKIPLMQQVESQYVFWQGQQAVEKLDLKNYKLVELKDNI